MTLFYCIGSNFPRAALGRGFGILRLMSYFLLKTEPGEYSIDDLERDKRCSWGGVRNYQARNIMRDQMHNGDLCIIYHSSCAVPAAVGVGEVTKEAYADPLQFDSHSEYFDPDSKITDPRWMAVEITFRKKFTQRVTLSSMRQMASLEGMRLLARGNRLSVIPLSPKHFESILRSAE